MLREEKRSKFALIFSMCSFPNFTVSKPRKTAFTIAEIIIVLGIIGIIANVTLPGLIANYQEKVYSARLLKTISELNQALAFIKLNGDDFHPDYGNTGDYDGDGVRDAEGVRNALSKYIKYQALKEQLENFHTLQYRWYKLNTYSKINSDWNPTYYSDIITLDGRFIGYAQFNSGPWGDCHTLNANACGIFLVDLDGPHKGPDTIAKDVHFLFLRQNQKDKSLFYVTPVFDANFPCSFDKAFLEAHPWGSGQMGCSYKFLYEPEYLK